MIPSLNFSVANQSNQLEASTIAPGQAKEPCVSSGTCRQSITMPVVEYVITTRAKEAPRSIIELVN